MWPSKRHFFGRHPGQRTSAPTATIIRAIPHRLISAVDHFRAMIERSTKRNTTAVPASDHDTDNHLGKQNADSDTENRGRRDRQCDIGRCWTMIVDRNPLTLAMYSQRSSHAGQAEVGPAMRNTARNWGRPFEIASYYEEVKPRKGSIWSPQYSGFSMTAQKYLYISAGRSETRMGGSVRVFHRRHRERCRTPGQRSVRCA